MENQARPVLGRLSCVNLHDSAEHEYSYSFLDFTLVPAAERLLRGAEEIKLRPKSFQVLRYLIERHGRLVTREELMQAAWGDVAVTDESISKCIADIRKALGDDSQQIVRTVTRRGFLFQAEVRIEQPSHGLPQTSSFYPKRRVPVVSTPVVEFPRQTGGAEIEPGPLPTPIPAARRLLNRWIVTGVVKKFVEE